jgi:hypothetical protein
MKSLICVLVTALMPSVVLAQAPRSAPSTPTSSRDASVADDDLATPTGHDAHAGIGSYTYAEPGAQGISIHGPKFGVEYTDTLPLGGLRHWFAQADVRGAFGKVTYDGWCAPWQLTPDSTSPNGYALDLGDYSPCSETGDRDWYAEGRFLVGRDFIGRTWGWRPHTGLGLRHLSNGTTGVSGYRTDDYLYLPFGVTARTKVASRHVLALNLEYDRLLHGWQRTRDSRLGGGDIPATTTAPEFTLDAFSDVSFAQHDGWAVRASAKYAVTRAWFVEPFWIYWRIGDSPVNSETATFTVNGVTARQDLGAYEPFNTTNELGVTVGVHF